MRQVSQHIYAQLSRLRLQHPTHGSCDHACMADCMFRELRVRMCLVRILHTLNPLGVLPAMQACSEQQSWRRQKR